MVSFLSLNVVWDPSELTWFPKDVRSFSMSLLDIHQFKHKELRENFFMTIVNHEIIINYSLLETKMFQIAYKKMKHYLSLADGRV